jgi:L-rhamnose-H+ transport protein
MMISAGILLVVFSGICNGLFSAPMKRERCWPWETTWFIFIVVSCILMPWGVVLFDTPDWRAILASSPSSAIEIALGFGLLWGFGAICFGRTVESLGVSLANTLIIGLSSALGSLVPLFLSGSKQFGRREYLLFAGIATFLVGVSLCGRAGWVRDRNVVTNSLSIRSSVPTLKGYAFATMAGLMSAVFNIGFALALPIADVGVRLGQSRFAATNCIWLMMLGAGAVPNLIYCGLLMSRKAVGRAATDYCSRSSWLRSIIMGLLWGGSIFLYGAAIPKLGVLGPSLGWPLSLSVGLIVANLIGILMNEWKRAGRPAVRLMAAGLATLLVAILLCSLSSEG